MYVLEGDMTYVHASACGHMFIQVQQHWFCRSSWVFCASENQATYFAAQPRLLKPNVVTHLFILPCLSLIRLIKPTRFLQTNVEANSET